MSVQLLLLVPALNLPVLELPTWLQGTATTRRPSEAIELRDALIAGGGGDDLETLVQACCQARVPFRAELLGDGELWRATPVRGKIPRWQRNAELLPVLRNRAGQAYSLSSGGDAGSVINYGEVLGRAFYFRAEGTFTRAAVSVGAKSCPLDFDVSISQGGVVVGGLPFFTSAISGAGYLRCLYLDEDIRIFESPNDSPDKWEESGLVVVQVLPKRPHGFLVAFEPLVDKWALLLARNARARVVGRLGWHHERGVILPFAVSDREGVVPFYVSPRDGCSSLRKTHTPQHGGWKSNGFVTRACAKTVQTRMVPAVTLRRVLDDWLAGWSVTRLKIDAQGADLSLLAAAGAGLLRRVAEVSLETLHDSCDGLYDGQPNCTTTLSSLRTLGFEPTGEFSCDEGRHFHQGSGCEANVLFRNVAAPPVPAPGTRGGRRSGNKKAAALARR